MNDILPDSSPVWQYVEKILQDVVTAYGYQEMRMPLLESTELFKRSIGEVTDIVEKEMYTFADRNGDSLTLRPEGTAGCVRAAIESGLLHNQQQRFWYAGPMFRHERPQRGRYRQFHQLGVESFGIAGPDVDAELILMSARIFECLGLTEEVSLQLNSLGTLESRNDYRKHLVAYFEKNSDQLDEDSQRRLHTNPLRIIDSKNPEMRSLIEDAPKMEAYLDDESKEHFDELLSLLDETGMKYDVNPCLVRGLDYYSKTVFEWVTDRLGAQGTVCAGGRFDSLVDHLGGKHTTAAGFAIGLERMVELVKENLSDNVIPGPHAYMVLVGDDVYKHGLKLSETLRQRLPELRLIVNCGGGSFKAQMKRADKSGADVALLMGEDEIHNNAVTVKYLRKKQDQVSIEQGGVIKILESIINV
jgi:histidyl-tRNA synthetase